MTNKSSNGFSLKISFGTKIRWKVGRNSSQNISVAEPYPPFCLAGAGAA